MRLRSRAIVVVAVIVGMSLTVTPVFAVDATQWGSGIYSYTKAPGWDATTYPVWSFDITMTLEPLNFVTALPGDQQADPSLQWRFTGMVWQPDGGNLANRFMTGTYVSTDLPEGDWVHGPADHYGQPLNDGFVGVFVDDDGSTSAPWNKKYDNNASDFAEWSKGLVLDPNNPLTVSFSVDIWLPHGPATQNAQMGWTGYDETTGKFTKAQNSIHLTPELPPSALLGLAMLPLGLAYIRGRRRNKED